MLMCSVYCTSHQGETHAAYVVWWPWRYP